ncbi:bacteriohemerythrin [Phosphitispora fastidiosa]|uniref:bacteriohemerythrin n=1 Tax=Phosphitispora fastidiosa TaxID=2837202 RepID=UPI001E475AA9|nr:bacteriohemerythrin [Phosphitispora fastidiosa]MBU7007425.1 hemerythrin-like metal-binding protein [Phosphitispora fastidiosa]
MSYISWDDKFITGIRLIDDQHKALVQLINNLHDAMMIGKGKQAVSKVIQELVDYTVSHFSTEEKFMIKYSYPWMLPHRSEHKKFVDKVSEFQKGYNEGKMSLSIEIMNFLKDWLVNHIQSTDKKLGPFLSEKGLN